MKIAMRAFCRVYQVLFHLALPVLPYREPERHTSVEEVPGILQRLGVDAVLLVTDPGLRRAKVTDGLEKLLAQQGIRCVVYDGTCANPTVENIEQARALYLSEGCRALIAFGGGSSMDCAKAVGARIAYPKKSLDQLKGLLRVLRQIPPLIAIPTTAGTGSEVTVTAVITDRKKHHKYTMNDFTLIPRYAVLDPQVTLSLPPQVTATTGMDALTHAVEAYIGRSTTKETRRWRWMRRAGSSGISRRPTGTGATSRRGRICCWRPTGRGLPSPSPMSDTSTRWPIRWAGSTTSRTGSRMRC